MEIAQIKSLLLSTLLLITLFGCAQEKTTSEDPYYEFKKEVYTKLKYPSKKITMEECLLEGHILVLISIDKKGLVVYDLIFASNQYFKDTFYNSLRELDVSSLKKDYSYLVPITYKLGIRESLDCTAKSDTQKYFKWISEYSGETKIDYIFEPFEFYGVTPIY